MANSPNQKRKRAERARDLLRELQKRFPDCFGRQRKNIRPIAIGIDRALRETFDNDPDMAKTPNWLIRQCLAVHTRSPAYLDAVIAGGDRVDLSGNPVEPVTAEAIELARTRREEQRAWAAERRQKKRADEEAARRQARLEQLAKHFND